MAEQGFTKWIIVVTVIMASLLELIDTTVVNVALDQMMGNLGATLEDAAWVVTSYAVANVIILPMTSWLSSKFGRKNYFAFSVMLFTVASFFCGHAHNIWELAGYRFIQGIGGGALLSTSQSIMMETFKREDAGLAQAIFGMGVIIGPAIGPILGGYIVTNYSWPWIFYINLPLGIMAFLMILTFIKESPHRRDIDEIDWLGIFLLVVSVGSLQIFLERGQAEDWFNTTYITVLAFTSAIGAVSFIWWELVCPHPIVDLRILRDKQISYGMIFTFVLGFGLFGSIFAFPIFLQSLLGFTAAQVGVILVPSSIATVFMMPFIGIALRKKFPPQIMACIGLLIFAIFSWWMSKANLSSGLKDFFWPLMLRGVGLSLLFVPLTTMALSGLQRKDIAQGTGLNNMVRQLGGSFGVALISTFLARRIVFHRNELVPNISMYNTATLQRYNAFTQGFVGQGYSVSAAQAMATQALDGTMSRQVALLSYMDIFIVVGYMFLLVAPLVLLQRTSKKAHGPMQLDAH